MVKKIVKRVATTTKYDKGDDMSVASTSNNVYVKDKEFAWVPARLISRIDDDNVKVSVAQYKDETSISSDGGKTAIGWKEITVTTKDYQDNALPLQNIRGGNLMIQEDMVDLPFLHEAAILYNVKARHCKGLPYTRTGDIVIAVNPYQWLQLYTEKIKSEYANKLVWHGVTDGDPRRNVAPHVYETSALCYKGLCADRINQSILVSGESGAGKTETVKICMNHIASVQRGPIRTNTATGSRNEEYKSVVVQRVLDSNPLLEAFGNAKTRRNDNSSRFGKYVNLQFKRKEKVRGKNFELCEIAGSKCDVYLLEKSRIVQHEKNEGTYHIFYQLLSAPEELKEQIWSGLKDTDYDSYKYVGEPSYERKIEGMTDAENYEATIKSLALIGVQDDKLMTLMRAICTTLALGNLSFDKDPKDEERSIITSSKEFSDVQELLQVDSKTLELAFTERTMTTNTDTFKVPLKHDAAKEGCDAYAKEIYARTFLWLVREINAATCAEGNYEGGGQKDFGLIGLLDIFGFESFPVNGFEQLCINYANEKLQQKFTEDIFQSVKEEYEQEGIDLDEIKYDDNSDVLQLIEGRSGMIKMLNEECVRPKGNDQAFVSKVIQANKSKSCIISAKTMGPLEFGIHHYAGKVVYQSKGFVVRNTDTLPFDLHELSKKAVNEIISKHLENDLTMKTNIVKKGYLNGGPVKRGKSNLAADTIWTKFKSQLHNLMSGLSATNSRYIRCLKPNTEKKPLVMEHMTTVEQLRCAGVVAAVTIARSAFPNRLEHKQCLDRFKSLKEKGLITGYDLAADVVALLDPVLTKFEKDGKKGYVMGETRVYFKGGVLEFLEQERMKNWSTWVIEIQRFVRGYIVRQKLSGILSNRPAPMAIKIQCWFRRYLAVRELKKRAKKRRMARKAGKKRLKAVVKIQSMARGCLVRSKVEEMIREKQENVILANKIKEMEARVAKAERRRKKEVEEAQDAAEKEIEEYMAMVKQEVKSDRNKQKRSAHQQTLINEGGKIIEYLRKENVKVKTQNDSLLKEYKSLKEENIALIEANATASQSFTALNEHATQLNATNSKLIRNVEVYKKQLEKLKDDLKARQTYYLTEAEARLAYQKAMAQIISNVQEKCRYPELVEDIVIMALECEASAKAERSNLDVTDGRKTKKAQQAHATAAAAAAQKQPRAKYISDSDSDSDYDTDDS